MPFALDYLLLVFLSSSGAIQLAVSQGPLYGLRFIKSPFLNKILGLLLIFISFTWFFVSEPRNIPDSSDGLDGNQQALFFILGAGIATIFTILISSLNKHSPNKKTLIPQPGLESLNYNSFYSSTRIYLKLLWKR